MKRNLKILGTGSYLPEEKISAEEIDTRLELEPGATFKKSGVHHRAKAPASENAIDMALRAANLALEDAKIEARDIDAIVCAHAVPAQLIPSNASLLQRALGVEGNACWDINSTCLSFVSAVEQVSFAIAAGYYNKVLIVSSEKASVGLTWKKHEVISLFGDGAGAAVLARDESGGSQLLASVFETFSEGADFCRIVGGGTSLFATEYTAENHEEYLFHMDGPQVFRLALPKIKPLFLTLLEKAGIEAERLKLLIPHQASAKALTLVRRSLGLKPDTFFNHIETRGNMVAASIPVALDEALRSGAVERGDHIALMGTSAGLSIGGLVLRY